MRPRLTLRVFALTFAILAMLAAVTAGFFALAFYPMSGATMISLLARGATLPFGAGISVVFFSSLCGALAWASLFALRRDGTHHLEAAVTFRHKRLHLINGDNGDRS